MRILHLSERFRPLVGGLELAVERLATAQVAHGHEVHVATLTPLSEKLPARFDHEGVEVHRLGHLPLADYHPPCPDPVVSAELRRLLRQLPSFEVVHGHGLMSFSFVALKRLGLAPLPFVWKTPDYGLICPKRTRLYMDGTMCHKDAPLRCLRCASAAMGPAKASLSVAGLFASRPLVSGVDAWISATSAIAAAHGLVDAAIIPPGIAETEIPPDLPLPAGVPQEPFIMYAGRLGAEKGTDVLLAAYEALGPGRPPLLLVAAASTEPPASLPSGAVVLNDLPQAQVQALWRRAALAVVPSVWQEPASMAAVEAMAAGTPLVASRVGGIPETVGDAALLVPPGEVAPLGEAISRLLHDPSLRDELSARGLARAKEHSISHVVPLIDAVYAKAIAHHRQLEGSKGMSGRGLRQAGPPE